MRAGQIDLTNLALPLTLRPAEPFSDDDLMRFSEVNRPYKIERNQQGEITIMTPVGGIGSNFEMYVVARLYGWAEEDATGMAFGPNGGFNLPDGSCLSPDGAWLPFTRWRKLSRAEQTGFPPLCPDFIIEVRSRTDPRRVVAAKMQTWLDNGAQLAWLIDPIDCNITIYRPGRSPETLDRPETIHGEAPVDGFILRTARLWTTP